MITNEAKQLLKQSVVMWDNNPDDLGTVLEVGSTGFVVRWHSGLREWHDYRDAEQIELYQPRERKET